MKGMIVNRTCKYLNGGVTVMIFRNGHPRSTKNGQDAPEGHGCPRCQCLVYHADQVETHMWVF